MAKPFGLLHWLVAYLTVTSQYVILVVARRRPNTGWPGEAPRWNHTLAERNDRRVDDQNIDTPGMRPLPLENVNFNGTGMSVGHRHVRRDDESVNTPGMCALDLDPAALWEKTRCLHPKFFEMTPESIKEVGLEAWYRGLTRLKSQTDSAEFDRLGEGRYFGEKILGQPNFDCSLGEKGCGQVKSDEEIVSMVEMRYTARNITVPTKTILTDARKIIFATRILDLAARYHSLIFELIGRAQVNVGEGAGEITERFTNQKNFKDEIARAKSLETWNRIWKVGQFLIDSTFTAASFGAGVFAAPAFQATTSFGTALVDVAKIGVNVPISNMDNGLVFALTDVKKSLEGVYGMDPLKNMEKDSAIQSYQAKYISPPDGKAHLDRTYSHDLFDGPAQDINFENLNKFTDHIRLQFDLISSSVETHFNNLFNGSLALSSNGTLGVKRADNDLQIPALAAFMGGNMLRAVENLEKNVSGKARQLTNYFMRQYILSVLASNTCYVKGRIIDDLKEAQGICSRLDPKNGVCNFGDGKETPSIAAQVKCWTSKDGGNHEYDAPGVEYLKEYGGLEVNQIIEDALYKRRNGIQSTDATYLEDMVADVFKLDGKKSDPTLGDSLPICVSTGVYVGPSDEFFPATCGNWMSDKTPTFMQAIGYAPGFPDWDSQAVEPTVRQEVPNSLRNELPLNRFLAYCKNNIRSPIRSDYMSWKFQMEPDPLCPKIEEEVHNMTEIDANRYFCEESETAKELFYVGRGHFLYSWKHWIGWLPGKTIMSHENDCKWFRSEGYPKLKPYGY